MKWNLILTVEIGQNRNEIGNIKIITNLLAEYYSHLKGYLKKKIAFEDRYITASWLQKLEKKGRSQVSPSSCYVLALITF